MRLMPLASSTTSALQRQPFLSSVVMDWQHAAEGLTLPIAALICTRKQHVVAC